MIGFWVKRQQQGSSFLGFMTMDSKVCSLRFHLCRCNKDKEEEDLIDISIKQVGLLNQVEISKVYHCDGLLLCVVKDNSRLLVWNPYSGQTKWIGSRTDFHRTDRYALGYDMNRNHKILRFLDSFEIYDFSSSSWRVIEVTPDWDVDPFQGGVSVKGNTYFFAHESTLENDDSAIEDFLLCFDFTREIFGPRLPLPFHTSGLEDTVTLSCVREKQLAVLYQEEEGYGVPCKVVHIWVTTRIEPNSVSWTKFLTVEMRPFALTGVRFDHYTGGTFFIDEEQKVAVVFDLDGYFTPVTTRYHTAFIIGEDGYFKPVTLGVAPKIVEPCFYCRPLVCSSSYHPSLVQLNQPR